jgi:hypothetical protein
VGKHLAADGAAAHPLVAAALARRAADATGAHREENRPTGNGLGWPAPLPPPGDGLGWPGSTSTDSATAEPARAAARRGWRRFFRLSSAA